MQTLQEIYPKYIREMIGGDKGTIHSYIEDYEMLLAPYRLNHDTVMMEIGVLFGDSIRMWGEYFTGKIIGLEAHIRPEIDDLLNNPRFEIIHGDATNPAITNVLSDYKFDVIIDDGVHSIESQVTSFNLFKDKMKSGGIYVIEDILDIDAHKNLLLSLHPNCEILDKRHVKNRFDDILVIYRF